MEGSEEAVEEVEEEAVEELCCEGVAGLRREEAGRDERGGSCGCGGYEGGRGGSAGPPAVGDEWSG